MMATLKIGAVIDVHDRDYRYGTGRLILRVTTIGNKQWLSDGEWIDLDGLSLRPDGTQISEQPRHALVRVNALRLGQDPEARL
ncbi:hypothetical protein ACN27F_28940 [Solwaraspora sp. WMMB335]|uniref:hypothetical protein n=1 Tax=Solwaraspora sp. WMMB335 TaxID=3404118 RepID=UPI003B93A579